MKSQALSMDSTYNEMETDTMVQVTIAIPRIDGYEEVTTFEYESLRFDDGSEEIDEDFTALVADGAGGEPVVEVLALVFDEEYYGTMGGGNDDVTREIKLKLTEYLYDEMKARLGGEEPVIGSFPE